MKSDKYISLLNQLKQSDESALRQLYMEYYDILFRFAIHLINNPMQSEEIVSDVFFNLWQNRNKLPEIGNLESYLYKSVKNTALHYAAKEKNMQRNEKLSLAIEYIHDDEDPENILITNELNHMLTKAIESLPDKCRIIFKLVCEDGLRYKEIADILDISVKTIDAQMKIARLKIEKILGNTLRLTSK